jgi:hypothetical protein
VELRTTRGLRLGPDGHLLLREHNLVGVDFATSARLDAFVTMPP